MGFAEKMVNVFLGTSAQTMDQHNASHTNYNFTMSRKSGMLKIACSKNSWLILNKRVLACELHVFWSSAKQHSTHLFTPKFHLNQYKNPKFLKIFLWIKMENKLFAFLLFSAKKLDTKSSKMLLWRKSENRFYYFMPNQVYVGMGLFALEVFICSPWSWRLITHILIYQIMPTVL